jgi:hypothetical protein
LPPTSSARPPTCCGAWRRRATNCCEGERGGELPLLCAD